MADTVQKLPSAIKNIAIEGVIGAGKTTLCKLLAEHLGARTVLEQAEENPFLSEFYKNRSAYALQTQLWFLVSRYKQFSEALFQQDLFHEIAITDYLFAKDRIFASINLDENELKLYDTVASILERDIPRVDYVVYLQVSTDELMRRIEKRGRQFEFNMDYDYIDALNEAYNHYFFHYTESPLLIINANAIDFLNNAGDREEILEEILEVKQGTNFYQPLGAAGHAHILKKQLEQPQPETPDEDNAIESELF
jgi:deoxyadenosine/deoxycytidine kinase